MIYLDTWDFSTYWSGAMLFAVIAAIFLFANTLRRKIPFLKKALIPTAVLGGFIGLGLKYFMSLFMPDINNQPFMQYTNETLSIITYHSIAIGFIALTLRSIEKNKESVGNASAVKSGLLIVGTYVLQAVLGLFITISVGTLMSGAMSDGKFSGVLLALGFGQGPGQANNVGMIYADNTAFSIGKDFGLTIAALGFLAATVPGVFYLNHLVKKGKVTRPLEDASARVFSSEVEGNNEIPLVESIDKLTVQIAFVTLIYGFSWVVMELLTKAIKLTGDSTSIVGLIWGFNFLFSMAVTMAFKKILGLLKKKKLMTREYTNSYMLNRISGVAFDYMILCGIAAIDVSLLSDPSVIVALILMAIVGTIATFVYCDYVTKIAFKGSRYENMLIFYGNLTGTASTGIALLREVDPDFKTDASNNLVTGSGTAVLFGGPLLLITGFVYRSDVWLYGSLAFLIVFFLAITAAIVLISRRVDKKRAQNK